MPPQAVSRLQREVSSASADLAGLYRSAMSPEMRARERALRAELQVGGTGGRCGGV
jgi:hypothetical protein